MSMRYCKHFTLGIVVWPIIRQTSVRPSQRQYEQQTQQQEMLPGGDLERSHGAAEQGTTKSPDTKPGMQH